MVSYWMIYGVNGYIGWLVVEQVQCEGLMLFFGGCNLVVLYVFGSQFGLECWVFDLGDLQVCCEVLDQMKVVVYCVGLFFVISMLMIVVCCVVGIYYVDIIGEIVVFEQVYVGDVEVCEVGIVVCLGVGFDVIFIDCLVVCLKEVLLDV